MKTHRYLLPVCAVLTSFCFLSYSQDEPAEKQKEKVSTKTVAYLGIAMAEVHPVLREHLELKEGFGVQVSHVPKDTPAEAANLKAGDVLTQLDEQLLTGPEHLSILVRSKNPGDKVTLTYLRKGAVATADLTLTAKEVPLHPEGPGQREWMGPNRKFGQAFEWKDGQWTPGAPPSHGFHHPMPKRGGPDKDAPHPKMPMDSDLRNPDLRNPDLRNPDLRNPDLRNRKSTPPEGTKQGPEPHVSSEISVKIDNNVGEVSVFGKDGKNRIEIKDAEGNEVYAGPYDRKAGIEGLPENARNHLEKMKINNIDLLNPVPRPVPPKPQPPTQEKGAEGEPL